MSSSANPDELLHRALSGDDKAMASVVDLLTPVVQACVARALLDRAVGRGRNIRQEVEDLTQEVFIRLLVNDARALRAWDPERGLSLKNFAGLLAGRHVASVMRSKRRNPWSEKPVADQDLHDLAQDQAAGLGGAADVERQILTREMLEYLLLRLEEELSPLGRQIFELVFVKELQVPEVCERMRMKPDAVYAWRSRLIKLGRRLLEEVSGGDDGGAVSGKGASRRRHSMVAGLVLCQLLAALAASVVEVHP